MTYKDALLSDTFTVNMPTSEAYASTLSWLHSKKVPLSKPDKADQIIAYYTNPLPKSGEKPGLVRFNFTGSSEGTVVEVDFPTYYKVSDMEPDIVLLRQDFLPEFLRMYRMHMGVVIDEKWLREMYPEDRRVALVSMNRNGAWVFVGVGILLLLIGLYPVFGHLDSWVDFVDTLFIFWSIVMFSAGLFIYWWYSKQLTLKDESAPQSFAH